MDEKKIYSIGEAASLVGMPTSVLRYYDSVGLLVPQERGPNNYRYYSLEQIETLYMIRRLRSLGCDLTLIKKAVGSDRAGLHKVVEERVRILSREAEKLKDMLERATNLQNRLNLAMEMEREYAVDMSQDIHIIEIPKRNLFVLRRTIKQYDHTSMAVELWRDLYDECARSGNQITGPAVATFRTEPMGHLLRQDCELELGLTVDKSEGKNIVEFGGFRAATVSYFGSHALMSFVSLMQWINTHGYQVDGYTSEEFVISPPEAGNQENCITKTLVPIRYG